MGERVEHSATVTKRVWDKRPIDVTYDLPPGVTITGCTVSAREFIPPRHYGADVSDDILVNATASFSGGTVTAVAQGGNDKARYELLFKTTFSDGSRDEEAVLLIVDNSAEPG